MRVLIAGGVFRLNHAERMNIQRAPEEVLADGLSGLGVDVTTIGLKKLYEAASSTYDIVHVHHMSKMAVAMALRSPRRLVFTHHASTYATDMTRRSGEEIVWRKAAAIVALSQREATDKILRFPFIRERLHLIPNAVPPLGEAVIHRTLLPREEFRIAFVGKLNANKRPELAIQALEGLAENFTLEFTYHENLLEPQMRTLADSLGVSHRVRFSGQAHGDDLEQRYQAANLLVLTSEFEALPSVIFEALMTGCPVVATDVGGIAEQVGDAGILVPQDVSDYAPYIRRAVLEYPRLSSAALARGQALRVSHSAERMARAHLKVYQERLEAIG